MRISLFPCVLALLTVVGLVGCKSGGSGGLSLLKNPFKSSASEEALASDDASFTRPSASATPGVADGPDAGYASTGAAKSTYPGATASYNAPSAAAGSPYPSGGYPVASADAAAGYKPSGGYSGVSNNYGATNSTSIPTVDPYASYGTPGAAGSGTPAYGTSVPAAAATADLYPKSAPPAGDPLGTGPTSTPAAGQPYPPYGGASGYGGATTPYGAGLSAPTGAGGVDNALSGVAAPGSATGGPATDDASALVGDRYASPAGGAASVPSTPGGAYTPGVTGYDPGNTGYMPPGVPAYQSPAGAYQVPGGTSPAPAYRPGGTSDYNYVPPVPKATSPLATGVGAPAYPNTGVGGANYGGTVVR